MNINNLYRYTYQPKMDAIDPWSSLRNLFVTAFLWRCIRCRSCIYDGWIPTQPHRLLHVLSISINNHCIGFCLLFPRHRVVPPEVRCLGYVSGFQITSQEVFGCIGFRHLHKQSHQKVVSFLGLGVHISSKNIYLIVSIGRLDRLVSRLQILRCCNP